MKTFHIYTQVEENYGAHCWDGEGECPQHWKMKGGNSYIITAPDVVKAFQALPQLPDGDYCKEYVLGHEVVEKDFKTDFEKSQLEYEGTITYPAFRAEVA